MSRPDRPEPSTAIPHAPTTRHPPGPEPTAAASSAEPVTADADAQALFDLLPVPAWLVDPDSGRVVDANAEAVALLGGRPATLPPVPAAGEAGGTVEATWPHTDGGSRTLLLRERALALGGRALRCLCAVDVTARHAAEEALRDANRRKDELLAGIGHELRDPLAPICNAMSLLDRATDPRMVETAKALMSRQLGQMVRTIDELLEVSRLTTGKLRLVRERFELQRVLHLAAEGAQPALDARGLSLAVQPPDKPVWLDGDVLRLAQVFSRLLEDASRQAEPGGRLGLSATATPQRVQVIVHADGPARAPEALERLFDPLGGFDADRDRTTAGGLGLGLPLARRLVELHGGTVHARAGPSDGTTFVVELPVSGRQDGQARWSPPGLEEAPTARRRIVVADDNVDAADSLSLMLQLAGHQVVTAYDGLAAFDAIRTHHPHVAILDLGMPVMDGHRLARRVREQPWGRDVVLVAVTGWGQPSDRQRSREAGFDHHLTKPSELSALEAIVNATTGAPSTAGLPGSAASDPGTEPPPLH